MYCEAVRYHGREELLVGAVWRVDYAWLSLIESCFVYDWSSSSLLNSGRSMRWSLTVVLLKGFGISNLSQLLSFHVLVWQISAKTSG